MNQERLQAFLGQILNDLGGAFGIALVRMGKSLGLYSALAANGAVTSRELAAETGLAERYVREWLSYHAASNYLSYDPASGKFTLPPEQAAVLADEGNPLYMAEAFDCAAGYLENQPKVEQAFRTGGGVRWDHQAGCLSCAIARFFRPGYHANLVSQWLPSLDGVIEKLERGARVVDVGCGHGYSTVIMAEAFPNSEFTGFDFHAASIDEAKRHAKGHGMVENVKFDVSTAKTFSGKGYDLVTCFDCLHDMGDPIGAARHIRNALKPDGTWMIVEPFAHDRLEANLNPVGRVYYAASTMVCLPTSLDQEVGAGLGAQAGEGRLRAVATAGGFRHFRRATETPFNLILEARP